MLSSLRAVTGRSGDRNVPGALGKRRAKGANAVVAMRFDCNEIGDIMSEIAAYGTAVTVEPAATLPEAQQER
jgi:hypothetical protein